jgi:hypothetical protein
MQMTVSRQDRVRGWLRRAGTACVVLICAPSYWLVANIDGGCLFGDLWISCPAWCPSSVWLMALGVAAQVLIVALAAFAQSALQSMGVVHRQRDQAPQSRGTLALSLVPALEHGRAQCPNAYRLARTPK